MGILEEEVCRCKAHSKCLPAGVLPPSQGASACGSRSGEGLELLTGRMDFEFRTEGEELEGFLERLLPSLGPSPRASRAGTGALGQRKENEVGDRKEKEGGQSIGLLD